MVAQYYNAFVGYALGGTAAVILFILMYRKSSQVANSGNKAKMATFSVVPSLLVIASILAATAAFNFAVPRLQNVVTSQPVVGALEAGGMAAQAIDGLLTAPATGGGGGTLDGYQAPNFEMMSFDVPNQPVIPNSGWLNNSLNNVAPDVVAAPTIEPTEAPVMIVMPTATPYVAPTPIHAEIQQVRSGHDYYVVQPGDSMFKIAEKLLGRGSRYPELCGANVQVVGSNCSALRAGMKLRIPGDVQAYRDVQPQRSTIQTVVNRQVAPTRAPVVNRPVPTATPQRVPVAGNTYTIVAGDSVYSIASKTGAQVYDICVENRAVLGDNCDNIQTGATLVIP